MALAADQERGKEKSQAHRPERRPVERCVCSAAVAAVVVIVIVAVVVFAVPLAEIDDGEIVQVASSGSPEQASLIAPENPEELDMETELAPLPPGDVTTTTDCVEGTVAKKPGVITKVCDCVVALALKLPSPP